MTGARMGGVRRLTAAVGAVFAGLVLTMAGAAPAAAQGADLIFPADQFDKLSYQPRQSTGDTRYESILMDMRQANFEPLALLAPEDPVRRLAEPVGLLKVMIGEGYITCTASIIDASLILTNWHCLPKYGRQATKAALWMGYYRDDERSVQRYEVDLTPVETGNADLDYAILSVKGDLSAWGRVVLAGEDPPANRSLAIAHHPAGQPKQMTQRSCRTADPPIVQGGLRHKCDTLPGSSGAPVFYGYGEAAKVVALHFSGVPQSLLGIDPTLEANRAVPMSRIAAASPVVKRLIGALGRAASVAASAPASANTGARTGSNSQAGQPGSTAVSEAGGAPSPSSSRLSAAELSRLISSGAAAHGRGDYAAALKDYTAACEGGDAAGCHNLGLMTYAGQGVARNYGRAWELFQKGCDGGVAKGCFNVAALYERGEGVAQDFGRARELYRQACDGGEAQGCTELGALYARGLGVAQDYGRARELYQRACDGGEVAGGCFNLGLMYANGQGVAQDFSRARALYQKA
ncbi:trypsin-like serine protease, partial [bacterium]|nr:trypsin-like serine protease [bacterium]